MILITNADHYIGHSITSHLCSHYPDIRSQLRILCQNDTQCAHFRKHGIDVRQVDYQHPHYLSLAMRKVDHVVLVVGSHMDRVTSAKNICRVAQRSGIKSIIPISHVGALCPDMTSSLMDYALIEEEIINTVDCAWTILRTDWIQQDFHLWTTHAERYRTFPLPINANTEFCPIDIQDVCESVSSLLLNQDETATIVDELDDLHVGQVYTLTGPQVVNGKDIIQSLVIATHYPTWRFMQIRPMDLRDYLYHLQTNIFFDARLKKDRARILMDDCGTYRFNIIKAPSQSDQQVQDFLDYFDWVSHTSSSIFIPHVQLLTNKSPRSMDAFFLDNAISFKPRE
ncbi:hypothetical protein BC941DRAFT_39981 [Chlamydoabsidia padenii]|nr:hypothetical protein BC941DRAFT_39981 [Chlamydoabsidia padenii]